MDYLIIPDKFKLYLLLYMDIHVYISGIRLGQTLMETKHMRLLGAKALKRKHPECVKLTYDSDAYWKCYIQHQTLTLFNPVGTCKMGAANDSTAVVDHELR